MGQHKRAHKSQLWKLFYYPNSFGGQQIHQDGLHTQTFGHVRKCSEYVLSLSHPIWVVHVMLVARVFVYPVL
jgi:hypothetical protein